MPVAKGNEARISNLRQIHFQIFLATQLYFGRQNSKIPSFWLNWACFSKMKATFRLFPIQSSERILLLKNVLDKNKVMGSKRPNNNSFVRKCMMDDSNQWMFKSPALKSLDFESGPFTIPSFERWKLRNSMSVSQECIDIIIHFCIYAYCKNDHGSRKRRDEISKNLPSCWQSLPSSSRFIFPHFLPILFFDVMCYIVSEALRTWPYMFKGLCSYNLIYYLKVDENELSLVNIESEIRL